MTQSANSALAIFPRFSNGQLPTVYYGSASQCTADDVSQQTGWSYYSASALPAPIAPTTFSDLARTNANAPDYVYVKSGTRIGFKTTEYTSADGFSLVNPGGFSWDTKAAVECLPQTLGDGSSYCVPYDFANFDYDSQRGNLFADGACSVPVFGASQEAPMYLASPVSSAGCAEYHFYRVPSAPLANPKLYARDQNNACAAYAGSVSGESFYRVTDCTEVQPSEFVPVASSLTY
jgi:hypothetical protein